MDPSCWSALTEYNEMGGVVDIAEVFGMDLPTAIAACGGQSVEDIAGLKQREGGSAAMQNLEKQKMAENLGMGGSHPTQRTAISLGKSSFALHVPFPHASSPQTPASGLDDSRLGTEEQSMLGDMDLASPGLTPIGNQRHSLLLRGGHTGAFPLTGDNSGGGMRYTPQSNSAMSGNLHNNSDYFAFSRGDMEEKGEGRGQGQGGRRVSFGPPSRLSFSSYGAEDEGGDGDFDEIPPSKYPRRSLPHGQGRQSAPEDAKAGEAASRAASRTASGGVLGSLGSPGTITQSARMKNYIEQRSKKIEDGKLRGQESKTPTSTSASPSTRSSKLPTSSAARERKGASPPAPPRPHASSPPAGRSGLPPSPPRSLAASGLRSPPRRLSPAGGRGVTGIHSLASGRSPKKSQAPSEDTGAENEHPPNRGEGTDPSEAKPSAAHHYADEKHKAKALVALFGAAQQLLSQYQCREALDILRLLPPEHVRSGFVNQLIGRAYLEMGEYRACLLAMREMLRLEPYRIQGTETMSTALWHMKSKKELCALGQQVGCDGTGLRWYQLLPVQFSWYFNYCFHYSLYYYYYYYYYFV
jgi:hypothetical protein